MDEIKPTVTAEHFFALDMRVGRVLEVADFPQARKPAWIVRVDFGPLGVRQTSAQVRQYDPEELVGRLVVGAMNLGPKRIAGFTSEFLLLGAVDEAGRAWLLSVDDRAQPGQRVA